MLIIRALVIMMGCLYLLDANKHMKQCTEVAVVSSTEVCMQYKIKTADCVNHVMKVRLHGTV